MHDVTRLPLPSTIVEVAKKEIQNPASQKIAGRRKHEVAALLMISAVMLLWGWFNVDGAANELQAYLHPSAVESPAGTQLENIRAKQATLSCLFGGIFIGSGFLILGWKPRNENMQFYLSTLPGIALIMLIALVVRWGLDPLFVALGRSVQTRGWLTWNFATFFHLNYILLGLTAGLVAANVFRIPAWAISGTHAPPRLCLKAGIILMGALYSMAELTNLSVLSMAMIVGFVFLSVGLVLFLSSHMKTSDSMTGVLAAGLGICGVSAAVAASSVVHARASEIAYTIATVLLWGVLGVFLFPTIGHLLGLDSRQFGVWIGTAIIDSSQVIGAALAFDPDGIETLKIAGIFNITRVLLLPLVILWLALWYAKREAAHESVSARNIIIGKFPLFVLGFLFMFALSSAGMFDGGGHMGDKMFVVDQRARLKPIETPALAHEPAKMRGAKEFQAPQDPINHGGLTSLEQDRILLAFPKEQLYPVTQEASERSHEAAGHHVAMTKAFKDSIAWLFTFGLIGLGMQIMIRNIKQAGRGPLIIGSTAAIMKAAVSLLIVIYFV